MMKNNENKKKKEKFSLGKLFRNNKFILVLSFVVAVIFWIVTSFDSENGTTRVISDIPIDISLSDEATASGLRIFSGNDETASVTVSGNRVTLGSISKEDIIVSAQTANTINTAGTYTLSLSPSKANVGDDFTITSQPSPSVITVYVDYYREKTFNIVDNVIYQVADGYYASSTLSSKTVTITGPQSEISKIDTVSVSDKLGQIISSDAHLTLPIKLYDSSGYEISSNLLTLSVNEVDVDVSVLPEKSVSLMANFKNKPSGLTVNSDYLSVDPEKILIAGPATVINNISSLNLDDIDFSSLSNKKQTVEANVMLPDNCRNLSNKNTANVTLDFSSMESKTVTVTKFSVEGLSKNYKSNVTTQSLDVQVIGPKEQLEELDDSNLKAVIDTSTVDGTTGSTSMPVKISISGADRCWIYGEYEANLSITKS